MRIIKIMLVLFLILLLLSPDIISAEEIDEEIIKIDEILDNSSDGILSENEISVENPENIMKTDLKSVLRWIYENIRNEITGPFRLFTSLCAVILLSSLTSNMYSSGKMNTCRFAAETTGVLISVTILSDPVSRCLVSACEMISDGGTFMLAYVPVMAGVMAAQGCVTTAGGYQLTVITFCELAVQLSSTVLIPSLSVCFSAGIVDAVNPGISLSGLISGIKKAVTLVLGLVMTVFTGLLTLQSTAGSAADTLTVRTGKYLVSNLVPVVGKAVSDSYSTVYGSLGVLKTGIGTAGVTVFLIIVTVPIIKLFLYRTAIGAASIVSDIFSCTRLKKLFSDLESVFGIIISIDLVFSVMLIISTVTVMKTGGNV